MEKLRALDLFCGAGGTAIGLKEAGFNKIVGVDIEFQPDYPFEHYVGDALRNVDLEEFDFIWASPPCQAYSIGGNNKSREKYPKLIEQTRELLWKAGIPFVIENVPNAPLRKDLMLCGEMFGLKVIRHRVFEIEGFECSQPIHQKHKGTVSDGDYIMVCRGGRAGCFGNKEKRAKLKAPTLEQAKKAMGINHITTFDGIAESIPPAYSEYIGKEFFKSRSKAEAPIPPAPNGEAGILGD
jgi:DNA (cytosine-5)-methyltransferase 1